MTSTGDRTIDVTRMILGGALGDAFGSFYENRTGPCPYIEHDEWVLTDDTILTLATAEALIASTEFDLQQVAASFVHHFRHGRIIRLGSATAKALQDLADGIDPRDSGATGERSAGNGPASRIAPLAICEEDFSAASKKRIRSLCAITHRNEEAYSGAVAVLAAIQGGICDGIEAALHVVPASQTRDVLIAIKDLRDPIGKVAQITGTSGYTAESVPLALYVARMGETIGFKRAIIEACCCGGDADTIASIPAQPRPVLEESPEPLAIGS